MPVPDLDPTARRAVAKKIRSRVALSIGPNSRDILDAGGTVALTPSECDEAAEASFEALADAGYAIVPLPLIDTIRAQTIRDMYAGRISQKELEAVDRLVAPVADADLEAGGPLAEAEALAYVTALGEPGAHPMADANREVPDEAAR